MKKWFLGIVAATVMAVAGPLAAAESIRLATTTSTYNSGLLDHLLAEFAKHHDIEVQVIAVGTGKALRMGQNGDVDVVMRPPCVDCPYGCFVPDTHWCRRTPHKARQGVWQCPQACTAWGHLFGHAAGRLASPSARTKR